MYGNNNFAPTFCVGCNQRHEPLERDRRGTPVDKMCPPCQAQRRIAEANAKAAAKPTAKGGY